MRQADSRGTQSAPHGTASTRWPRGDSLQVFKFLSQAPTGLILLTQEERK